MPRMTSDAAQTVRATVQQKLARAATASDPSALFLLQAEAPLLGLHLATRAGDIGHGPLEATMRIASVTKSFVAAAVLRLVEQQHVALDDPLPLLLRPDTLALLRTGGYRVDAITLRMLLAHTSGIADFATPAVFEREVLTQPRRRWTRAEQLRIAVEQGCPLAPPGAAYAYADSNYSLLGEALEVITGESMARAVRSLGGIAQLGLRHTWFESLEAAPADAPARLAQHYAHYLVADFDASTDLYGGGGLVSTLDDLARYIRALVRGELFTQRTTAALMQRASPQSEAAGGMPYGLGLELLSVDGVHCAGHTGFWGVAAWHCATHDITLTAAVSRTEHKGALTRVLQDTLRALAAASPAPPAQR